MLGITKLWSDLESIIFPGVCLLCGNSIPDKNHLLCPFCISHTFEDPNPYGHLSCAGVILPDIIEFQDALWHFDKGGKLQIILHALKYRGLSSLGVEIGRLLGMRLLSHPNFRKEEISQYLLVPVPLHPLKKRKRGYNQARAIAEGIRETSGLETIKEGSIIRKRHTPSQTGLSISGRAKNISKAFHVENPEEVKGKRVIVVDDVFTTGATTFELISECKKAEVDSAAILTIAQA